MFWGIINVFGTEANFSVGHHPSRALGYFLLTLAVLIFLITADRWKRVFPGIMLAATLGCLLELESGHVVNSPSILVPRAIAFIQLVVVAAVTALSFSFKQRPLTVLDRVALLAFAASIFLGGEQAIQRKVPFALLAGGACIFIAWTVARLRRNHHATREAGVL